MWFRHVWTAQFNFCGIVRLCITHRWTFPVSILFDKLLQCIFYDRIYFILTTVCSIMCVLECMTLSHLPLDFDRIDVCSQYLNIISISIENCYTNMKEYSQFSYAKMVVWSYRINLLEILAKFCNEMSVFRNVSHK